MRLLWSICKMICLFELFISLIVFFVIGPLGFLYVKIVCYIKSAIVNCLFSIAFFSFICYLINWLGRMILPKIIKKS